MARKRKRDWPQLVYKYAILPDSIPEQLWIQAKAMQNLWNDLAHEHECVRLSIGPNPDEAERKEKWAMFEREARYLSANAGLNWESDILDRFTKACVAAAKFPEGGWPKPHGLSVSIPHRFTGGGCALPLLWSPRAKRIRFDRELAYENRGRFTQDRRLIRGSFGLDNDERIDFEATVHCPIQADAIVKGVRLLGERSKAFDWSWSLAITVEVPHKPEREKTGKRAAIDVGWRRRDGGLRVGYLVDSDGRHEELLLPYQMGSNKDRRYRHSDTTLKIPLSYDDVAVLSCYRDLRLEELKLALRNRLSALPAGFDKMRSAGLIRLMHDLPDGDAKQLIQEWLDWDTPRFRRESAARARMVRHRRDLYSRWAARLCKQYDEIVVEDLGIKDMIEDDKRPESLKAANTYHQIAATAELISIMKRAGKKHQCDITEKQAQKSTSTCCRCGGDIATGPDLVLRCSNGHEIDQDENAATNLLSQTWPISQQKGKLRRYRARDTMKDGIGK